MKHASRRKCSALALSQPVRMLIHTFRIAHRTYATQPSRRTTDVGRSPSYRMRYLCCSREGILKTRVVVEKRTDMHSIASPATRRGSGRWSNLHGYFRQSRGIRTEFFNSLAASRASLRNGFWSARRIIRLLVAYDIGLNNFKFV
jgi:hypothetical protein